MFLFLLCEFAHSYGAVRRLTLFIWRFEGDAFGDVLPAEDVDANGIPFTQPIRMPGHEEGIAKINNLRPDARRSAAEFDAGIGISYNYFRDYDPATGRYIESDPIGLEGGLNTYGYVGANVLGAVDPEGLFLQLAIPVAIEVGIGGLLSAAINTVGAVIIEECFDDKCPPCSPYPVGTIGYQGPETHQRGINAGTPHYHLFLVQQIPSTCMILANKVDSLSL